KIGAVDADTLLLRLFVEQVHVGDQRVGAFGLRDTRALGPELLRFDSELRQEGIFLHRFRRQRAVEVIDEGDDSFVGRWRLAFREPAASAWGLGSRPSARAIIAGVGGIIFWCWRLAFREPAASAGASGGRPRAGSASFVLRAAFLFPYPLNHGRLFPPLDL